MRAKGNRKELIIATKVGSQTKEHGYDISKKHILKSVDESLNRLQTDYIDLYYTHFDDNHTPLEETLSAYDQIVKAGKVRYIAASNISPQRLEESFQIAEANGFPKYVALQPHYNLMERKEYESAYLPLAEKFNLTVFPYWALASGFLTGKYRSADDLGKSVRGEGVKKYLNEKGLAVLDTLDQISQQHHITPTATALAWLLAQPHIGAPIVSATSEEQLQTLFSATGVSLNEEDLSLLEKVSGSV